jgi:hypothetical protein
MYILGYRHYFKMYLFLSTVKILVGITYVNSKPICDFAQRQYELVIIMVYIPSVGMVSFGKFSSNKFMTKIFFLHSSPV